MEARPVLRMALFLSRHRIRVTKRRIEHTFAFGLPDLVAVCPASAHITLVLALSLIHI